MGASKKWSWRCKKALEPITTSLGEGLDWILEKPLKGLFKWGAETAIPELLGDGERGISGLLNAFGDAIDTVGGIVDKYWEPIIAPTFEAIGNLALVAGCGAIDAATLAITGFSSAADNLIAVLTGEKTISEAIKDFIGDIKTPLQNVINDVLAAVNAVAQLLYKLTGSEMFNVKYKFTWEDGLKEENAGTSAAESFKTRLQNSDSAIASKNAAKQGDWFGASGYAVESAVEALVSDPIGLVSAGFSDMGDWLSRVIEDIKNMFSGKTHNYPEYKVPKHATGVVLPGGAPYLAWINDQPAGQTNIEAPLDTIKQALMEVMASQNQNFTIEATGSMSQLIRMLRLEIKKEDRRATAW
ncbi:MAG: hypothetical protein HFE78_08555 [Clostridiales bacterium]|nr:hypothetical protein [Clostridiales bacterium]